MKSDICLPLGQVKNSTIWATHFQIFGPWQIFCDNGQVHIVFGQAKVEDHLPGGRQYYNLNFDPSKYMHIFHS